MIKADAYRCPSCQEVCGEEDVEPCDEIEHIHFLRAEEKWFCKRCQTVAQITLWKSNKLYDQDTVEQLVTEKEEEFEDRWDGLRTFADELRQEIKTIEGGNH